MRSLLSRFRSHPYRIRILERDRTALTVPEWRMDETLTNEASKLLRGGTLSLMVQVLKNSFLNTYAAADTRSLEDRAVFQSQAEGYSMAIRDLESLGVSITQQAPLESTFEPEPKQETE